MCIRDSCAIGYEAALMVLKGIKGFRNDFEEHVLRGRCICELNQPVDVYKRQVPYRLQGISGPYC